MQKGAKVKCLGCGDIIQSMHRHDYKACTCHKVSSDKIERCADKIKKQFGLNDDSREYHLLICLHDEFGTGITVDGGSDYLRMGCARNARYKILED